MYEHIANLLQSAADTTSWAPLHLLRSGVDVMRDAEAFDRAGSALIAVVVVAFIFVMPRD